MEDLNPDRAGSPERGSPSSAPDLGVFSEVGRLRSVLVCRPALAHRRLSPRNCREWEFDAPFWVERAQREFDDLVRLLGEHGVEVLQLHTLLAQTLRSAPARAWVLEHTLSSGTLGAGAAEALCEACAGVDSERLAECMLGGLTLADLGLPARGALAPVAALHPYLLEPLPRALFMREASAWVQHGVALAGAGRRGPCREAVLLAAVYRFHPRFAASPPPLWCGEPASPRSSPGAVGGDILPLGQGVVLIGVGERTEPQAALQIARALFDGGAAKTVIAVSGRGSSAAHHGALASVFSHCAPEVVVYNADVVDHLDCQELRAAPHGAGLQVRPHAGRHLLDVLSEALGTPTLRAINSGADAPFPGDAGKDADDAWDEGAGVLALAPGRVIGFERNPRTNRRLREAGVDVIEIEGAELSRCGATAHRLCCPLARDAVT